MLASARRTVGEGLRQLQTQMRFQFVPHRLPVLRRRFHHRLFDTALAQPLRQATQFAGGGAKAPALGQRLRFGDLAHHHHEHFLVHVDSCYFVGHVSSWWGRVERALDWWLRTVTRYCPFRQAVGQRAFIGSNTRSGPNSGTVSTYPERRRPSPFHSAMVRVTPTDFHFLWWAKGPCTLRAGSSLRLKSGYAQDDADGRSARCFFKLIS